MILVDTWAWIALACKRDQHHRRVKALHKQLRKADIFTGDAHFLQVGLRFRLLP
jgi:predicted nucleic acid-binding protein